MRKHTGGPWKDNGTTTTLEPGFVDVVAPAGVVAKVWVGDKFQTDHEEGLANLRLILKAPELLAMMPKVIEWDCPFLSCDLGCEKEAGCPLVAAWKLLDEITGEETDG